MKLFRVCYLLIIFLALEEVSTRHPKTAKQGCQDTCGKVKIPYPFGIGVNCSISEWYNIYCNWSTPFLPALNNVEVLHINLEYQTVTVNVSTISDCRNLVRHSSQILNVELGGSPFFFSRIHNKFVAEGCGNAVILDHGTTLAGCSTTCGNNSASEEDKCLGITCCQTTLPHYLKSYSIDLTSLERQGGNGACGYAFLVNNTYLEGRCPGQIFRADIIYTPISLLWTLSDLEFNQTNCCYSGFRLKVDMGNGTSVNSMKCVFPTGKEGNPYLLDGCDDKEECTRCMDDGDTCEYHDLYDDYDRISEYAFVCSPSVGLPSHSKSRASIGAIIGNAL
ncbi:hypothetical protein L2E82_10164 [Cichorium intybus]|uniref:Uncharacterized protein n=1 Tax=Cichorium intybus TaxID=13427 RepID=A0ACB9GAF3_CICIN|nr:hypothetical protein L2E82_10164 [Cichorium intybus]